jgi:subtilisin family serine protease
MLKSRIALAAARRHCQTGCAHVEPLEHRRLMSAALPAVPAAGPAVAGARAKSVETIDWKGTSIEAWSGEWILGLSGDSDVVRGRQAPAQVQALQRRLGAGGSPAVVEKQLGRAGQYLLRVPDSVAFEQVLAATRKLRGFEYLEPNAVLKLQATPNDPAYNYEYGLNNTGTVPFDTGASLADADIDAPEAWDLTTGSAATVVAVVDSGVDYTHPDLAANMWHNPFEVAGDGLDNDANGYVDDVYGIDAANNDGDPMDDNNHGTHVAGTIGAAGNNGVGITGVAWRVQIMALKFIAADGSGASADAIEALNYATSMRQRGVNVRLTNNSWNGLGYEQALKDAIAATSDAGMLLVCAAGNGGADKIGDNNDVVPSYSGNYDVPNIVTVASTDRWDNLAVSSNFGPATVDLAAPGVDITSTYPGNRYVRLSGTSMATPHVSGVAALAWSLKPNATMQEVRDALLAGVDRLPALSGVVATGGRLNALGTLRTLANTLAGTAYDDADGNGARGAGEAALSGRTVYLDLDNNALVDSATATLASTNVPLAIPDAGNVASTLSAAGLGGAVTDVDVTLDVTHTSDADLFVFLTTPAGQTVRLFGGVGGAGDNFSGTVLDDEAAAAISAGAAPFAGRFRPQGALADFDGSAPNGTWTLRVYDKRASEAGTLNSWSLTLTTGDPTRTTDAAGNYAFRRLTPGAYVVRQVVPPGWAATAPAAGYHAVNLVDGHGQSGLDFGSRIPPADATIAGFVWEDVDNDGQRDAGEAGRGGVTVFLDGNGNGSLEPGETSTTSAADGAYTFTGLASGSYRVAALAPGGFGQTSPAPAAPFYDLTLAAGQHYTGADFGLHNPPPTVGSLAASPDPAAAGTEITLTAADVGDALGGVVSGVEFYRETNGAPGLQAAAGGDTLLGTDATAAPYSLAVPTAGLAAGGYTYYARAFDDQGAPGAPASATHTVANAAPTNVSLTPVSATDPVGTFRTFTTAYRDANGAADFSHVYLRVNDFVPIMLDCLYDAANNKLYVRGEDGTKLVGGFAPGSANVISTTHGSLDCAQTTVARAGTQLTVNWRLSCAAPLTGPNLLYLRARDRSALDTGYQRFGGTWNVTGSRAPSAAAPAPLAPSSAPGVAQSFAVTYSDPDGWENLSNVFLRANADLPWMLDAVYNVPSNRLYLRNATTGALAGGFAPGSNNVISNGHGSLDCSAVTVTRPSATQLSVNWSLSAGGYLAGPNRMFVRARDAAGGDSGYQEYAGASWTVTANAAPVLAGVTPASGTTAPASGTSGPFRTMIAAYEDGNGALNLGFLFLTINANDPARKLQAVYSLLNNRLSLLADDGVTLLGSSAPGSNNVISNSRGSLNCAGTSISITGNRLTVLWSVGATSTLAGANTVSLRARDRGGLDTGFVLQSGVTWNVI